MTAIKEEVIHIFILSITQCTSVQKRSGCMGPRESACSHVFIVVLCVCVHVCMCRKDLTAKEPKCAKAWYGRFQPRCRDAIRARIGSASTWYGRVQGHSGSKDLSPNGVEGCRDALGARVCVNISTWYGMVQGHRWSKLKGLPPHHQCYGRVQGHWKFSAIFQVIFKNVSGSKTCIPLWGNLVGPRKFQLLYLTIL